MPVQHPVWEVGSQPLPLKKSKLAREQQLVELITAAPEILSGQWMVIARREQTGMGGA